MTEPNKKEKKEKNLKKKAPRENIDDMTLDRSTMETRFKRLLVERQWCDDAYAQKYGEEEIVTRLSPILHTVLRSNACWKWKHRQ